MAIADALNDGRTDNFAVGIRHPMALERRVYPDVHPQLSFSLRGHSIGGYGSVTINKVIASVFGKHVYQAGLVQESQERRVD